MYDQRPSVLATVIRTPHEGCDVYCVGLVCLHTIYVEEPSLVWYLSSTRLVLKLELTILIKNIFTPLNLYFERLRSG
jgi:hypothetical protein